MLSVQQAVFQACHTKEWPKVDASDGLTHRLARYDRNTGYWHYQCDQPFVENADRVPVSYRPLTCVACMGLEGRLARSLL